MSKGNWGADTTDERKPTWPWVAEYIGYANCFATGSGWTIRWPWGDEVLVALSNLSTKLGNSSITEVLAWVFPTSGYLVNAATQTLQVAVSFNEAITVSGTPTLVLISTAGESNITLSYNSASSNLASGKLVFSNQSFTLGTSGYASNTLVVNSSSTVTGWDGISDAETANDVANGVPTAESLTISVYQEKPVHVATLRSGTAKDTTAQQIGFALDFNDVVVVTGVPFVIAIGANVGVANTKLSYNAAASNTAIGNLVFQSAANLDFTALTGNSTYTLTTNGASTNTTDLWAGITGPAPILGVVTHGVVVANTFVVVQNEAFLSGNKGGANVTNSTAQVVAFTLVFDRSVLVNTAVATPTILAISNHASIANATLSYASGNGSSNLIFQSANLDLSTAANGYYFVNSTSTIVGFNAISNTGVASDLTGVLTGAVANTTRLVSA